MARRTKAQAVEAFFGVDRRGNPKVDGIRHIAGKVWEFRTTGPYGYLQRCEFTFLEDGTAVRGDQLYHVLREKLIGTGALGSIGYVMTEEPEFLETVTGKDALDAARLRHRQDGYLIDSSRKWDRFTK